MARGGDRFRTDLSFTLFLSDPDTYDGGALMVHQAGLIQSLKPAAGDLVLDPSTSLHEVQPVTQGARLACVGSIKSYVRAAEDGETLFDQETCASVLPSASIRSLARC